MSASDESLTKLTNETQPAVNEAVNETQYVTYIIGNGTNIFVHRFELDLEPDQDVEALIISLDNQMEALHGRICMRAESDGDEIESLTL